MLNYTTIEDKLITKLANLPIVANCEVRVTPDDWDADTFVYTRNSLFVQYNGESAQNLSEAGKLLTGIPVIQKCVVKYTLHIASQRLRASSQAGIYDILQLVINQLSGKKFEEEFGPLVVSDIQPIKRSKDKFWKFKADIEFCYWRRYFVEDIES